MILALVGVQLVVSLARVEMSPLLSTYDMYSTTYDSPAVFEQKATDALWLVVTDETGRRRQCRITPVEAEDLTADEVCDYVFNRSFNADCLSFIFTC